MNRGIEGEKNEGGGGKSSRKEKEVLGEGRLEGGYEGKE